MFVPQYCLSRGSADLYLSLSSVYPAGVLNDVCSLGGVYSAGVLNDVCPSLLSILREC